MEETQPLKLVLSCKHLWETQWAGLVKKRSRVCTSKMSVLLILSNKASAIELFNSYSRQIECEKGVIFCYLHREKSGWLRSAQCCHWAVYCVWHFMAIKLQQRPTALDGCGCLMNVLPAPLSFGCCSNTYWHTNLFPVICTGVLQ